MTLANSVVKFASITVVKQKKMWYNKNGDEKWKR